MDEFLQAFEERRKARAEADRTLTLAGETLTYRPSVAPEVGMRLEAMRQKVREQMADFQKQVDDAKGQNGQADTALLEDALAALDVTDEEMLMAGDNTVRACLEPASHAAWERLRSPDAAQPLTFDEVFQVADYLLGRVAGIPTVAPADSSDGRTQTDTTSTESSSSPEPTPTPSALVGS